MSDDALTDIANALLRLRHAFAKHRLEAPVRVEVANKDDMLKVAIALRDSTRLDYLTSLDAPREGGELSVNVCGIEIAARTSPEMRRVNTICFHEGLPPIGDD